MLYSLTLENGVTVIPELDIGELVLIYDYDANAPVVLEVIAIGYAKDETRFNSKVYYVGRVCKPKDDEFYVFNLDDVNCTLDVDEVYEDI